jgi:hypothetical protein
MPSRIPMRRCSMRKETGQSCGGTNQGASTGNGRRDCPGGTPSDVRGYSISRRTPRSAHTRPRAPASRPWLRARCTSGNRGSVPCRSKSEDDFPRWLHHATSSTITQYGRERSRTWYYELDYAAAVKGIRAAGSHGRGCPPRTRRPGCRE